MGEADICEELNREHVNDKEVGRKRAQSIRDANDLFVEAMKEAEKDAANAKAPNADAEWTKVHSSDLLGGSQSTTRGMK